MPKTAFSQWDAVAANNTDLNNIPLDSAVTVANELDDLFREMMAQLAAAGIVTTARMASTTQTGISEFATAAEFRAGADTARSLVVDQVWASGAVVSLTDAATIAVDMGTFINAQVTLGGNRTLGAPSNPKVGQSGFIRIIQDGTGSRTLAYHANWGFSFGVDPVLSTTPGATDILYYTVITSTFIHGTLVKAVS